MAELRNDLIPSSDRVDLDEIWTTVERIVPIIERTVGRIRL
jgi:uncharacterized protein with HEPN domain